MSSCTKRMRPAPSKRFKAPGYRSRWFRKSARASRESSEHPAPLGRERTAGPSRSANSRDASVRVRFIRRSMKPLPALLLGLAFAGTRLASAKIDESLAKLVSIGPEGAGNEVATAGGREIVARGPAALPQVLAAAGKGSAVADNWLRLAGDAIVDAARRAQQPLPLEEVEGFCRDTSHAAAGRQLAFDLLRQADRARAEALEPALIHDPVQELRRGAVQRVIDSANGKSEAEAKPIYLKALEDVRDEDQTKFLAAALKKMN